MNPSDERLLTFLSYHRLKGILQKPTHTKFITCGNNTNNSSDALKHAHSRDENLFVVLAAVLWYRGSRMYE